ENGLQDSGEAGVQGVTVTLYTGGNVQVATQATDVNGAYLFGNSTPGSYYVQFTAPVGQVFTVKDANSNASDSLDSDADLTTGKTATFSLVSGQTDRSRDAGLLPIFFGLTGTIGFWQNKNGQSVINSFGTSSSGLTLAN